MTITLTFAALDSLLGPRADATVLGGGIIPHDLGGIERLDLRGLLIDDLPFGDVGGFD
ncbi:MAG: hypothetical protein HY731_10100, partial [Candidatus Tectomicrobia bacterium]|nr:hypothetical protein [Candidatus Tectomicrobia bacterium]